MIIIAIVITGLGLAGTILSILSMFFEINVKDKIIITKRGMLTITAWIIIMSIGIINLQYIFNAYNNNIQETIQETTQETIQESTTIEIPSVVNETNIDNIESDLSEEERIIKQNYDLIQKLKAKYSDKDTVQIENNSIKFSICEAACEVYQDLTSEEKYDTLPGIKVDSAKLIILDYFTDRIIYTYTSASNMITYYSDNQDKFYCVVFHEDYDIYVSPPIQIIGTDEEKQGFNLRYFCLNKKDSNYSSLFAVQLCIQNMDSYDRCSPIPDDYVIGYTCVNSYTNFTGSTFITPLFNSGMLSNGNGTLYFSLNSDYSMRFYLYHRFNKDVKLAEQDFGGFITDSNVAKVVFDIDIKTIEEQ